MNILKRFLDPVVAMATVTNIVSIIVELGLISDVGVSKTKTIAGLVIAILIQIGIMKQPNSTKE